MPSFGLQQKSDMWMCRCYWQVSEVSETLLGTENLEIAIFLCMYIEILCELLSFDFPFFHIFECDNPCYLNKICIDK